MPTPVPSARPRVDVNATLRDLRREVDALLAAGKVSEAEARMEAVRLQLADSGVHIRKINQAYLRVFQHCFRVVDTTSNPSQWVRLKWRTFRA